MSRYIDADKIYYVELRNTTEAFAFRSLINRMPTVDAVEVVRCIECRYYETTTCPVNYMRIESRGRLKAFCSWGERKEDANK